MEDVAPAAVAIDLDEIRRAPATVGRLELIVRRPATEEREVLDEGVLDVAEGLVGDTWRMRGSSSTPDGSAHPGRQITLMNARATAAFAGSKDRWPLAGDQLYVDLDLSSDATPPGTRLHVGTAVLEITDQPHLGCRKFAARFGSEALRLVMSEAGRALNLRGVNARVIVGGTVRVGDAVHKAVPR